MIRSFLPLLAGTLIALPPAIAGTRGGDLPGPVRAALVDLQQSLQLTPPQQLQFARAMAATQDVLPQLRANHKAMLDATTNELEKAVPDLAALAVLRDDTVLADLALRQAARAEWLALYALLTPEQVALLREELKRRVEQMDSLRAVLPGIAAGLI